MSTAEQGWGLKERRQKPTPAVSRYLFWGRRSRSHDPKHNYYVDRPSREAWLSAVILICLSSLDALLSLKLFSNPLFRELNPLLLLGLQHSEWVFLGLKLGLTACAVFILVLHWNFVIARRRIRVVWLTRALILTYIAIVIYEVTLLAMG